MSTSSIFILDLKGKIVMSRHYKGDINNSVVEKFCSIVLDSDDESSITPIFEDNGISYAFIRTSNLYFVAVTRQNANATMMLMFLYRMVQVFKEYFKEVEEESIRDNFVVVHELLDEMMDYGYPQSTESKILQEYIKSGSYKLEKTTDQIPKLPMALTQAVSWRSEGIFYKKNEVFLDVVESLNMLCAANGQPLRSEILGVLKMRSFLSGMPELKLGLNDKILFENLGRTATKGRAVELDDVKFHQCVRLNRFESDRTISFVPPDGDFELMSYRLNTKVKPLIWVESKIEAHSHSRVEYLIKAKSQFKKRSTANNVEIHIPVPRDASAPTFRTSLGTAKYAPELDCIIWSIKQFPGGKQHILRAHVSLPSIGSEDQVEGKRPLSVKFEIPYFTVSGLQVRYLKIIEKSGYQALPWVRYITQSGDYQIRLS
eukprot:GEZU01039253.1.p1 GENE.GEZU01039253.1~~GEZU01039253.1.p1  ORF type:complete len:430 (+),score=121.35 GEZU01039253.1:151-1440(+)